ncbi:MAG TPA: GWxTD domain-containing protein [candidate division Zixibacteria bacterium]|nr:GWxTD domain-containing protein [candidate division Zixibacteria bacterium]
MRFIKSQIILIALLVGCFFITTGNAQVDSFDRLEAPSRVGLLMDYCSFMAGHPDTLRLEVYYQYYNYLLSWEEYAGQYRAEFDITIRVKDDDGRQVQEFTEEKQLTAENKRRTRSGSDFRTNQVNFILPKGKYEIDLILHDQIADVSHKQEMKVNLREYKLNRPRISDIELITAIGQAGENPLPFDKGRFTIIPSLTREFGDEGNSRVLFYFEVYAGEKEEHKEVLVETAIRRRYGALLYRDSATEKVDESFLRQVREVSIADLTPGEYAVEIRLRDTTKKNRELDSEEHSFYVVWSLASLLRNDIKEAVRLLELISEPHELDSLEKASTYEERARLMDKFWKGRDPTPGTAENEIKLEFFRRIQVANRNFAFMGQPGWATDRGIIYVKHGEPDQVDDYPLMPSRMPYQEWHYYRGNQYLKFTFVDRNGDGDYRLVYPYDGLNQEPDF